MLRTRGARASMVCVLRLRVILVTMHAHMVVGDNHTLTEAMENATQGPKPLSRGGATRVVTGSILDA